MDSTLIVDELVITMTGWKTIGRAVICAVEEEVGLLEIDVETAFAVQSLRPMARAIRNNILRVVSCGSLGIVSGRFSISVSDDSNDAELEELVEAL